MKLWNKNCKLKTRASLLMIGPTRVKILASKFLVV